MRCAVFGCSKDNQSKDFKENPVKFYTFPKEGIIRKQWVLACCRNDKFNADNARICSRHFTESDFERNLQHELLNYTTKSGPKLKEDAVPSLDLPKNKTVIEKSKRSERSLKRSSKEMVREIIKQR